ncbi:MAG: hypothetical protein IJO63_05670 [Bacilli bacterium]|nr:hypothetical protein [Bacilli bacterium]
MDVVTGINEEELKELCLEVMDYSERIMGIFDKVDEEFELLKGNMVCNSYDQLMNSYRTFRANYLVVKNNINSYSDDFIALIQKLQENAKYLSTMFVNATEDMLLKAKQVKI